MHWHQECNAHPMGDALTPAMGDVHHHITTAPASQVQVTGVANLGSAQPYRPSIGPYKQEGRNTSSHTLLRKRKGKEKRL